MPHVIVKLGLGNPNNKRLVSLSITKDVMEILHYGEDSVSVAMEEVKSKDWVEKVYKPDVKHNGYAL